MTVTPEQLAEWRRLADAATAGPWSSGHSALPCPSEYIHVIAWALREGADRDEEVNE